MKENIADLVEVSFIKGELIVVPKDGVKVIQIESVQPAQPVDDWVDNFGDLADLKPLGHTFDDAQYAIAQLKHLMMQPCVNGDWKPDWDNNCQKWCIEFFGNRLQVDSYENTAFFLTFKDNLTAEKFLQKYRSYIEQAAPILFSVEL